MPELILKDLSKSFGPTEVLKNISLEMSDGELLVLLGPSGCGKSTCLRLIAGLEEADSGEIYIGPRRVDHLSARDRNVAMVFQNYSLYPHMSVAKNLAFPLKVAGVGKAEIADRVEQAARMLGLSEKLQDKPGQLSGGQRQRVALGRAIIRKPDLFLLDEPLSNLDADLRGRMRREIVRIQKQLGVTTVHVTHDQAEALTMGDRIALLNEGRIVQMGSPQDLYRRPASLFVANFLGHPKINVVTARMYDGMLLPFGLPVPRVLLDGKTENVLMGVRPESIEISSAGHYAARVVSSEYMGDGYVIELDYKDNRLTVSQCATPFGEGEPVKFSVERQSLLYFDATSQANLSAE